MALTTLEQQKRLDAQLALAKKQLLESKNNTISQAQADASIKAKELTMTKEQENAKALLLAKQAYATKQNAQRVMPNQLASGGLKRSGYIDLAKQKLGNALGKQQSNIKTGLDTNLKNVDLQKQASELGLKQTIANANLNYNQNLARQNLDYTQNKQAISKAQTEETAYKQSIDDANKVIGQANLGKYTYDQYKVMLDGYVKDGLINNDTRDGLLVTYKRLEAQRKMSYVSVQADGYIR